MEFKQTIENEEIQKLPLKAYSGEVAVIDDKESYEKIIPEIFLDNVLGFDTETKPSFKKGMANKQNVSLLQLSNSNKTFLFRLNKFGLQKEIITILSDPSYIKVGVSIRDDIKALQKLSNFTPEGFIELQNIVNDYGIENYSLKKLTAIVLNFRISKAQQLSNWEAETLTEKQIKYAATDSWTSREIYLKLLSSQS